VKNLESQIPLPPLFRGQKHEDSDDEDRGNKKANKKLMPSRFTLLSQRNMMDIVPEEKHYDFTHKEKEFGNID
jgi:hypothetical protein